MMQLVLPYPPSVNTYWRMYKGRMLISKAGREYRIAVCKLLGVAKRVPSLIGELEMSIDIYPPDKRRRDIDNVLKALLDAMGKAGVYFDDSQIKKLTLEMFGKDWPFPEPGKVIVNIKERQIGGAQNGNNRAYRAADQREVSDDIGTGSAAPAQDVGRDGSTEG